MRSGSLGGERTWPHFGPRVGRLGIHSALSLPLLLPGKVVGAINVCARGKDVFDDRAQELGELFAAPAAVAVHNAHTLSLALVLTARSEPPCSRDRSSTRPSVCSAAVPASPRRRRTTGSGR